MFFELIIKKKIVKNFACFIFILIALFSQNCKEQTSFTKYVDPVIGTDQTHLLSMWRMEAGTYPGAVAPHGMAQLTPETSRPNDFLHGYYYTQDTIRRFSLTEHFSGWPNGSSGKGMIMPFSTTLSVDKLNLNDIKSAFSHDAEKAEPGYYSVFLKDPQILCEFGSLEKSSIADFSFNKEGKNGLFISGYREIEFISNQAVIIKNNSGDFGMGKEYTVNIYITFNDTFSIVKNKKSSLLFFNTKNLKLKYGVSYTSPENAKLNVETEIPDWDLNKVREKSKALWNKELSKIEVEGGTEENKTIFYTARYHASLLPVNATDVNRQFPGYEKNIPLANDETHYIFFDPWDQSRTTYPFIFFFDAHKGRDYMRSIVRFYNTFNYLPEPKVMTSVYISVMTADAIAKGVTDFDVQTVYKGLKDMILEKPYFRKDMSLYDSLGFIPYPKEYATTATMEFAYNDWALAQIAKYMNDNEVYEKLMKRSFNYRNNYHPQQRFMLTKNEDGTWSEGAIYAEADKWNMSWMVPHNVQDLINLMGGEEEFTKHLEQNFEDGHYIFDNENPIIFPLLFIHAKQSWKTMDCSNSA